MSLIKKIAASLVLIWPAFAFCQGTLQITFDGPPAQPPNSQYGVTSYSESGMLFLPGPSDFDGQFERANNAGGTPLDPDDGSAFLQTGYGESLEFTCANNSLFGLVSIDLAAYGINQADFTVDFVGFHTDGSTISTSFSGTGIDFQTYHFSSAWSSGLTKVEIPNAPWSLDNLVVAVPEPSSGVLFMLGAVTFTFWRLRKRTVK